MEYGLLLDEALDNDDDYQRVCTGHCSMGSNMSMPLL